MYDRYINDPMNKKNTNAMLTTTHAIFFRSECEKINIPQFINYEYANIRE